MHIRKGSGKVTAAFLLASAVLLAIGFSTRAANADISNPHPTPPTNSITNAMLQSGSVAPAQIQQGNTFTFTGGSGSSIKVDSIVSTSSQTLAASTTIGGVGYQFPGSQGAANTTLQNNGTGVLTWTQSAANQTIANYFADANIVAGQALTIENGTEYLYQQPSLGTNVLVSGVGNSVGNTFFSYGATTTSSFTLKAISIEVWNSNAGAGNLQIQIQTSIAGLPSGFTIATGTIPVASLSTSRATTTVVLSTTPTLTNNTLYFVTISCTGCGVSNYLTNYLGSSGVSNNMLQGSTYTTSVVTGQLVGYVEFDRVTNAGYVVPSSNNIQGYWNRFVGFATQSVASGAVEATVIGGQSTGLSGLTVGSLYYVGTTTGTISTSAGTNSKEACFADAVTSCIVHQE